ncbi:class I SAM-dependent methyltransferase [Puia sp.]|jgi:SAM-dependent methyltransferase|uniref:class I SAM-dependent methyltransferase n=1 Tax=Puia sp. TaxID=2045100 RepID=UPI002F3F312A
MKLHIGCGDTLLDDFVNIDNSPSLLLARLPLFMVTGLRKLSLLSDIQLGFIKAIKTRRSTVRYADCLHLPYKDNTVDLCYSSHVIGWYLSHSQLRRFFAEMKRVLRPGGVVRLSWADFDVRVRDYLENRDSIALSHSFPMGMNELTFKDKLKLLFSPHLRGGVVLNTDTTIELLRQCGFERIELLAAGETTMPAGLAGSIDLAQRADHSVYIECYKP